MNDWLSRPFFPLLREIVGTFGRFLRADQRTLELTHPMYALVCMEVDISQPLPSMVWIGTGKDEGFYQKVVFEGKLAFWHHCNLQGHSPTECRKVLANCVTSSSSCIYDGSPKVAPQTSHLHLS